MQNHDILNVLSRQQPLDHVDVGGDAQTEKQRQGDDVGVVQLDAKRRRRRQREDRRQAQGRKRQQHHGRIAEVLESDFPERAEGDPELLASAIIRALKDPELRASAAKINAQIIAERANFSDVMAKAEAFYEKLLMKS